jgi:predicted glycosyltransferase
MIKKKRIATEVWMQAEVEHMKIPSTRCTAIVGRYRTIDVNNEEEVTEMQNNQRNMLLKSNYIQFKPRFRDPSKTHQNRKDDK